jgi:protein-disulfide isomerase
MRTWGIRTILDVVTTMALLAASCVVIWAVVTAAKEKERGNKTRTTEGTRSPSLPSEPASLHGAFRIGATSAPVAIIEYSDFQCPFCAKAALETVPTILHEYVDSGKALFVFRHLPLQAIHPFAVKAAEAAECANRQGKFLEMHDTLFRNQRQLQTVNLQTLASSIGLRRVEFDECLVHLATGVIETDIAEAHKLGITGTPTFLFGTLQLDGRARLERRLTGAISVDALSNVMGGLLDSRRRR